MFLGHGTPKEDDLDCNSIIGLKPLKGSFAAFS